MVMLGIFQTQVEAAAMYNCIFGDKAGEYLEEIVDSNIALNCEDFCECVGFAESTCYFGPDDKGNFIEEIGVSSEMADSCDRAWCICDTHDFKDGETFESIFAKRQATAVDRTVPNKEPTPVTSSVVIQTQPVVSNQIEENELKPARWQQQQEHSFIIYAGVLILAITSFVLLGVIFYIVFKKEEVGGLAKVLVAGKTIQEDDHED